MIFILILLPFLSLESNPIGKKVFLLDSQLSLAPLAQYMEYIPDSEGTLQFEEIKNLQLGWNSLESNEKVNFDYSSHYYWIRFTVQNTEMHPYHFIFDIGFSRQDMIEFFYPTSSGEYVSHLTGDTFPFHTRDLKTSSFAFELELPPQSEKTYFVRTRSIYNRSILNPNLFSQNEFQKSSSQKSILHGSIYGILGVMFLYNLFLFLWIREKIYLYSSISILSFLLLSAGIHGTSFQYLYPQNSWLQNRDYLIYATTGLIFIVLFTNEFLYLQKNLPTIHKYILPSIGILVLKMLFDISFLHKFSEWIFKSFLLILFLFLTLLLSISIYLSIKKIRAAYFYMGSFLLFFGSVLFSLATVNFLTSGNTLSFWAFQIGFSTMLVFLALGTADRIHQLKDSLESANENLENKIEERTGELKQALLTLNNGLKTAKRIQSNLLTPESLQLDRVSFSVAYLPLEQVGGDLYDIFQMDDGTVRIFLADATGHGVQAALMTMSIFSEYQSIKKYPLHPNDILTILNQQYYYRYYFLNTYFTCILVDIDVLNGKVSYASAGHPTQYIFYKDSLHSLDTTGKLMGVINNITYKELIFEDLSQGRLVLFSDGIFEGMNQSQDELGEEKFLEILKTHKNLPSQKMMQETLESVKQFLHQSPFQDDITFLIVDWNT
jgi:serine phosphatase RsbU (regulator of sigma subunit)